MATSRAIPGFYPLITINGRRYMDRDLAAPPRRPTSPPPAAASGVRRQASGVLILIEPLAHLYPHAPLDRAPATAGAGTIKPEQAAAPRLRPA
jgi:hypothetical protein